MKRRKTFKSLVSCFVSFCMAFSMFGIVPLAFADEASSSSDAAAAEEYQEPVSDSSIDVSEFVGEDGNFTQVTGTAQITPDDDALNADASGTTTDNASALDQLLSEANAIVDEQAEDLPTTEGNELEGATVKVTMHTYISNAELIGKLQVTLTPVDPADNPSRSATFVADTSSSDTYVADFSTGNTRVPAGTYMLSIKGNDHVSFTHEITLENGIKANVIIADNQEDPFLKNYGIIPYGDFNSDNKVTNEDVDLFVSDVVNGRTTIDLNGDADLDIADLQLFASTLREGASTQDNGVELINLDKGEKFVTIRKDASGSQVSTSGLSLSFHHGTTDEGQPVVDSSTELSAEALQALLRETLLGDNTSTVVLGNASNTAINDSEEPLDIEIATANSATDENTVIGMEGLAINYPTETAVNGAAAPASGVIVVEGDNGELLEIAFGNATAADAKSITEATDATPTNVVGALLRAASDKAYAEGAQVDVDTNNGIIKVDFGSRIAVKKITIRITETTSPDAKLVEIGKVEFLNNMEDLIAPPELNIPSNINATVGNKQIDVSWPAETNVSGYEIMFTNGKSVSHTTLTNSFSLREWPYSTMKDVRPGNYTIKVRSISGDWTSGWSDPVTVNVPITEKPKRVTNVSVVPGYKSLTVSWPASEDAETYTLYYKEASSTGSFVKQDMGASRSYTLMNLKPSTKYTMYVTASNQIGTSGNSDYAAGTTYGETAVKVPWYNLINRKVQDPTNADLNNHITSASIASGALLQGVSGDANTMVDGRYDTGTVFVNQNGQISFTFDQAYNMNSIVVTTSINSAYGYGQSFASLIVQGSDGAGNNFFYSLGDGKLTTSIVGSAAPNTYVISFPSTNIKNVSINQGRYYSNKVAYAEVAFYESDGISDAISALWADDVRTALNEGVTEETIAAIEKQVNTPDPDGNDECTPYKDTYLKELAEARSVLQNQANFRQPKYYDNSVNKISSQAVSGINGWQPLGVAALEDDELKLYIGGVNRANGQRASLGTGTGLNLVACQYNSTPEKVSQTIATNLRTGENTIKIPNLSSLDAEVGGQLYIEYTSTNNYQFGVRVLGGQDIATLDLHNISGDAESVNAERMSRISSYIAQLEAQVNDHEARHAEHNSTETNDNVYGAYNAATCVANTTDIMMDDMMYSVPASQILAGINGASGDKAAQLNTSLKSMEYMMKLFYQHKGLTNNTGGVTTYGTNNAIPTGHQNIRLMRMKDGVFMYAAGNHIGIPFGSTNLTSPRSVEPDAQGKDTDAGMFGWGIAHEIGHEINQGCYTITEVTNNYYSQLSTNNDPPTTSRYTNDQIFNRVTSGTYSPLSGATGIGCYWQLHLAYDNNYNLKTFDSYTDQMNNLIFARMDAYARNPQSAPGNLTLSGGTNNCLARLAMAATQKDLTDYFDAWGLTLDETTKAYAKQFPKETRLVQYVTDAAQEYRINGGTAVAPSATVSAELYAVEDGTARKIESQQQVGTRELQIKVTQTGGDNNGILGYEILRNGQAVAFQQLDGNSNFQNGTLTFTDKITTENNRTYTYSVRAVDKLLNASKEVTLPQIKVSDDGTIADKSRWTATTNLVSEEDEAVEYDTANGEAVENATINIDSDVPMPCENEVSYAAVTKVIDGDDSSVYSGSLPNNGSVTDSAGNAVENAAPYIEIDFGAEKQITAIKVPIDDNDVIRAATVQVSTTTDETGATEWVEVNTGTEKTSDGYTTFYFDEKNDPQLKVYKASKVRITGDMNANKSGGMTLHEIDFLGVTGDNADFLASDAVGKLASSVQYASGDGNTIAEGTLVFMGDYKGDTAYNALKMRDQEGRLVPGTQVFFAERPGEGSQLGATADGRWIWFMDDEDIASYESVYGCSIEDLTSVQVELYRVDDAQTLANERHVADTLTLTLDWDKINSSQVQLQISQDYKDMKTGSDD